MPSLVIYHPLPPRYSRAAVMLARLYGAGMGRVLRKHDEHALWGYYFILFPLGGALIALLQGDLALAWIGAARTFGRLQGWRVRLDHKGALLDLRPIGISIPPIDTSIAALNPELLAKRQALAKPRRAHSIFRTPKTLALL